MTRAVTGWRVGIAAGAQLAGRVVGLALGLGVAATLGRGLGTAHFGDLMTALLLLSLVAPLLDFGLGSIAVREMAAEPQSRAQIAGAVILVRLVAGVALALVAMAGAVALFHTWDQRWAAVGALLSLPLSALGTYQAVAQARLRPELISAMVLTQSTVWLAAVVVLTQLHAPLAAYGLGYTVSVAAQGGVQWWLCHGLSKIEFRNAGVRARRLYSMSWPLGLTFIFTTTYYRMDSILLYRIGGSAATGRYTAAYRFLDSLQIVPNTMVSVLLPVLSSLWGDPLRRPRAQRLLSSVLTVGLAAVLPLVVGGMILSGPIVTVIYGPAFRGSARLLTELLPAFVFIFFGYVTTSLLTATRQLRALSVIALVGAVLNVAANLVLIPRFGADAAAWTTVATEGLVVALGGLVAFRGVGMRLPVNRWLRIGAAGAALAGALLVVRRLPLPVAILLGGGVYLVAVVVLRAVDITELRAMLRRGMDA
ncbi:MAG TPA: flippase [Acidimicrobiales bacterium]